jgi:foldase protein PrsA
MKRLLVLVAALAIVATACSDSDGAVASVNGADITRSHLEVLAPDGEADFSEPDLTRYLSVVIQWKAVSQAAAAEYGIEPTEDEIDAKIEEFVAEQGEGATLETYLAQANVSGEGIRQLAEQVVIQDAIQLELATTVEALSEDALGKELIDNYLDWTVVCAAHILVDTEDEAVAVLERIDAGEDFATVATEVSTDTGSGAAGGDLGCTAPSDFVPEFSAATMAAEINVVTEPVESEFGFHVILVTQREEATPEVVRAAMEGNAVAGVVETWFVRVIGDADVVVDEEIGVWVTDPSPQVLTVN